MASERQRTERLQIMLSLNELEALEDFRFKNRLPSRAAAFREALRRGLGVVEKLPISGASSSDPGVLRQRKPRR